jgi:hypothetical protein
MVLIGHSVGIEYLLLSINGCVISFVVDESLWERDSSIRLWNMHGHGQ